MLSKLLIGYHLLAEQIFCSAFPKQNICSDRANWMPALALANEWNKSAKLLVLNGADLTVTLKNEGKEMLATYLAGLQPDVLHELLDQDVSVDDEQDHLLRVDFRYANFIRC